MREFKIEVFLKDGCYFFCVNGYEVKFIDILDIVDETLILNDKDYLKCSTEDKPDYIFLISKREDDSSGFVLLLTNVKKTKVERSSLNKEINIEKVENNTFTIKQEGKNIEIDEDITCKNILSALISLVVPILSNIISSEKVDEFLNGEFSDINKKDSVNNDLKV